MQNLLSLPFRLGRSLCVLSLFALGCLLVSPVTFAQEQAQQGPSAQQIITMARSVFANERYWFEGKLKPNNRREDIDISMSIEGQDMVITIEEAPKTNLYISLAGGGGELEIEQPESGNARQALTGEGLSTPIRKTDLSYEDIGMRFLYWEKGAQRIEDALVSARECWTVRLSNPGKKGPYGWVFVRVDQKTAALMQVIAYDHQGRQVKNYRVEDVQLHRGQYYLRKMRIESINHQGTKDTSDDKVSGRTFLVMDKPKRQSNGFD